MARKHSWGKDLGSDTVQIGKIAARGIEQPYHDRLFGYFQGKYGKAVSMEVTRGRSRPDIVVWDTVAIEVKGPTGERGVEHGGLQDHPLQAALRPVRVCAVRH